MTTGAIPIGRISAFVRWVARTPWPVFTLGMLQADIIGALLVLGFLRFGLPPEDRIQLQDLPAFNLAIFLGYLFLSFTVGSYLTLRMLIPVMRWQRRDTLGLNAEQARVLVVIELKDIVKGGMRARFDELRKMGIRTIMITGDNPLTAAAIANAVYHATGIRVRDLPITLDKLLR